MNIVFLVYIVNTVLSSKVVVKSSYWSPCFPHQALIYRHAGVLALAACVQAFPYDVPDWMPQVLLDLGEHLHDPNPIQVSQIIVIPVLVLSGSYVASCRCRVYKVNHVIGVWLTSQSASEKHNQEKKPTNLCALGEFLKKMSAMFDDHTISLFWL